MAEGAVKRKKAFLKGERKATPLLESRIQRTSDTVKKEKTASTL